MSTDTAIRRQQLWLEAEKLLEKHNRPILKMLGQVILDMADELENLGDKEQDVLLAIELGYRLDKRIDFSNDLLEAFDGVVASMAAFIAIKIYRSLQNRAERLGRRIDKVEDLLEEGVDDMATGRRRRLEKRLERMKKRLARL